MVRTVRLLRLAKTPLVSNHFIEQIRSEELLLVAHICKIMGGLLICAHFVACFWYGIGLVDEEQGWVAAHKIQDTGIERRYIWSLHWSLAMFVGETLIESETSLERGFAVAVLFFGFMFSSFLLGSLTTAMTRLQIISSKQSGEMAQLRRYLLNKNISRPLVVRVQRNAQHALAEQKRDMPENSVCLLALISDPLMTEIHFEIFGGNLTGHPFFSSLEEANPAGMRKICHTCIVPLSLSCGDVLFADHEAPTHPRMYFVQKGDVEYKQECSLMPKPVERSQWLCEAVLWTSWTHRGTLRAISEVRMLALNAEDFQNLFKASPDIHMSRYALAFVEVLNQMDRYALSDVGEVNDDMYDIIAWSFPDLELNEEQDEHPDGEKRKFGNSQSFPRSSESFGRASARAGGHTHQRRRLKGPIHGAIDAFLQRFSCCKRFGGPPGSGRHRESWSRTGGSVLTDVVPISRSSSQSASSQIGSFFSSWLPWQRSGSSRL